MASDVFGIPNDGDICDVAKTTNGVGTQSLRRFSVDEVGFFEGPEKLLEVWFDLSPLDNVSGDCDVPEENGHVTDQQGLRTIPKSKWEKLLELVHCEILSSCSNDYMDAYLLSESSLFVSSNRFVLKTCGTTTLLHAVKPLFELVDNAFPKNKIMAFFYSHRNFQKPHLQLHPHNSFEEEARYLDEIFEDGAAYALGRLNGDTWYLYTMCMPQLPIEDSDQTLEILMTDLDADTMALYSTLAYSSADQLMHDTGITDIIPGAILDAKIFEPCGFSVNAIVKGDAYFTIHVTPQIECSWVSFETNRVVESYSDIISKVLAIFNPGNCTISLFVSKDAKCGETVSPFKNDKIDGYRCKGKQCCSFDMYNLTFGHFTRTTPTLGKRTLPICQ